MSPTSTCGNPSRPPIHLTIPSHHPTPRLSFPVTPLHSSPSQSPRGANKLNPQLLRNFSCRGIRAVHNRHNRVRMSSPWDDKPFEILPNGKRAYLDEQDIVTFLDPPKELIPLDAASYNPAAYLWRKIDDIPEERRGRLLNLLEPRLISRAWEIAGTRYEDPKLAKKSASDLLSGEDGEASLEFYNCRSSGGLWAIAWMKFFKKVIFRSNDGKSYGRFIDGSIVSKIAKTYSPLYFLVTQHREVMSTEQPCDLAYEFGDGCLNLRIYPRGFPQPVKHIYPFNDQVVIYVRHVGPGVLVGQAWQEGKELQQVPRKLCGEILMVKNYTSSTEHQ